MPLKYAIAVKTDKMKPRSAYDAYYNIEPEYEVEYQLAPKDYVEEHRDGFKKLISVTGEPLSGWMKVKRRSVDVAELKRKSKAPAVKDFFGTTLAVGDYVVTHHKKNVDLLVCEVIGFVKQGKARIMPVEDIEQDYGLLKFPSEIVKIPADVLGEDPLSEWIPSEEEMI